MYVTASDKNKALFLLMTLTLAVLKMNPLQWFNLSIKRKHYFRFSLKVLHHFYSERKSTYSLET